jgi:DNA polymerase
MAPRPHQEPDRQEGRWQRQEKLPADLPEAGSLGELREQAETCTRCPLYRNATQTVFGEGPLKAEVLFAGEQPGDQEDLAGRPFVGPAGRIFDAILAEAGIPRDRTYVTNAVKHFKFEPRGKKRIHSKPNAGEVRACSWWIERELKFIRPEVAVALGATAALSLVGKPVPVLKMRGKTVAREDGLPVFLTIHPSFLLRIRDSADKAAERRRFLDDMLRVRELMAD